MLYFIHDKLFQKFIGVRGIDEPESRFLGAQAQWRDKAEFSLDLSSRILNLFS